ncbi:MAG: hypothetical protein ISS49_05745 [Anaerolineae bacterium]|nr:hypothetical protein [Anaerolineae bacterium]
MSDQRHAPILNRIKILCVFVIAVLLAALTISAAPLLAVQGSALRAAVSDPVGDTFGVAPRRDVTEAVAEIDGTSLTLTVVFSGTISDPTSGQTDAVFGLIDLDTDQDQGTGITSHVTTQCPDGSNLGMDFYIDLSSYNT